MTIDLHQIVTHDSTAECIACRARNVVTQALVPAADAWETTAELPRFSIALHGAARLLASMIEEGIPREEVESALADLLDDIEKEIAEDRTMGGPPQGNA